MTRREERWVKAVLQGGCVLCEHLELGETEAAVHHIREGEGMSQRSSHFMIVPLCQEHHQGNSGFHGLGAGGFYQRYKLSELDLLAMTIERVSARL